MSDTLSVVLITGFLGAGKTTLINSAISANETMKFALIENEFGEVNIDRLLIDKKTDTIYELSNGCLCCDLQDGLITALHEIRSLKDKPDVLFVELSGMADPEPVVHIIKTEPSVCGFFHLQSVICLVDACSVLKLLAETKEIVQQVACADALIVSRKDLLEEGSYEAVGIKLSQINPFAEIQFSEKGSAWPLLLRAPEKTDKKFALLLEKHPKAEHSEEISSAVVRFDRPFQKNKLLFWLEMYLSFNPSIYRVKALVCVGANGEKHIVQAAGRDVEDGLHLEFSENTESVFVFIGKKIDELALKQSLDDLISDELEQSTAQFFKGNVK